MKLAYAYDRVTRRLSEVTGYTPPREGADWRCPAHGDNSPSLSVTPADDRVLIHCQAGCDRQAVLAALNMVDTDLFDEPRGNGNGSTDPELWTPYGEAVAIYDYVDEAGRTCFQVCRTAAKEFPVRVPDATKKSGWRWKWGDARRVIYRLPQVIQAVAEGWRVWIVEGEKDVHALERLGEVATCNPGGAGKWRTEYNAWLEGADVVIVADNDPAGAKHAKRTAAMLSGVARSISTVQAATGKDATDHLNAGHGLDEFLPFLDSTAPADEEYTEPEPNEFDEPEPPELQRLRSRFLDTAAVLALPPPEWLLDGILVRNTLAVAWGVPGAAKSFLALDWALSIASGTWWHGHRVDTGPVVYVAAEGTAGLGKRIRAWSKANNVHGLDRARWLPEVVNLLDPDQADALFVLVNETQPRLIVIDTLARSMLGGDENAAQDMGRYVAVLDRLRTMTDATILVIHHSTKEGSSARGSGALKGAVDTEIEVKKEGPSVGVFCRKQKDSEEFAPISLHLVAIDDSATLQIVRSDVRNDPSGGRSSGRFRELFWRTFGFTGAHGAELRETVMSEFGYGRTKAYEVINDHVREGFIRNAATPSRPFYELVEQTTVSDQSSTSAQTSTERPFDFANVRHPGGVYRPPGVDDRGRTGGIEEQKEMPW